MTLACADQAPNYEQVFLADGRERPERHRESPILLLSYSFGTAFRGNHAGRATSFAAST